MKTESEFLDDLAGTKTAFIWRSFPEIRSMCKGLRFKVFCPVTAVAYLQKGMFFSTARAAEAAKEIGLDPVLASRVVVLADRPHPTDPFCRSLFTALGLKLPHRSL